MPFQLFWLLLGALLVAGCERERDAHGAEPATSAKVSATREGNCKDHGVLAAICTKCNPKLIPVFQAKGTFCEKHGFPEAVCPVCHPERGGKPELAVEKDEAPADGLKLRFKRPDTARLSGIEWTTVTPRTSDAVLTAPARLEYDATKLAQVNARSPGVITSLSVDVGARVKKGDRLLVIDSPSVGADRARLTAAKARVAIARENLEREMELVREGIATRKSVLGLEQELSTAEAEDLALRAALSVMGAGGAGKYTLMAPLAGVITERHATIGKLVAADTVLLEIVDTSSMWADVEVRDVDLQEVSAGQEVKLTFEGLGEREISGKVSYVAPAVDPHTRSAKARVPLANPDGHLRAHMFGQARIVVTPRVDSLVVPRNAVQRSAGVPFVFVRVSDTEYEVRRVKVDAEDHEFVEIRQGLESGEQVVTTGSFLLKTETARENIGAGCCEL